ncbi:MAG: hypothetical protein WAV05_17370 [Anaerolineales bacterium]
MPDRKASRVPLARRALPDLKGQPVRSAKPVLLANLNQVSEAKIPAYPFTQISSLPQDYTLNTISYIVGGYF